MMGIGKKCSIWILLIIACITLAMVFVSCADDKTIEPNDTSKPDQHDYDNPIIDNEIPKEQEIDSNLVIFYTIYNPETNTEIEEYTKLPKELGDVSQSGYYSSNANVNLHSNQNEGYTFLGWFSDNILLSKASQYNYIMWDEAIKIEARYELTNYNLMVFSNNNDKGQVLIKRNDNTQEYKDAINTTKYYMQEITIAASSLTDVRFLGWYDEDNKLVSTNAIYSFNMPNRQYSLEAKWNYFKITYDLGGGERCFCYAWLY